eukprot:CAMPEP_0168359258 /NCGR_PEP_ID=MMETSP0228-20121227/1546_1 /TAXON_ID=133427 /ORGANISM="Protoceratium reticulatum, Strain CCCM 535 (=CCMP 1889)" /LENGTH=46 /DNA_ID= /DNA_START= /DNA_END= /DNA_ORIENTATION=
MFRRAQMLAIAAAISLTRSFPRGSILEVDCALGAAARELGCTGGSP